MYLIYISDLPRGFIYMSKEIIFLVIIPIETVWVNPIVRQFHAFLALPTENTRKHAKYKAYTQSVYDEIGFNVDVKTIHIHINKRIS